MITNTFELNKMFYKNKKTEQYIETRGLQLPKAAIYALSDSYDKASFNKSQVEQDLLSILEKGEKLMTKEEMIAKVERLDISGVGVEVVKDDGNKGTKFVKSPRFLVVIPRFDDKTPSGKYCWKKYDKERLPGLDKKHRCKDQQG